MDYLQIGDIVTVVHGSVLWNEMCAVAEWSKHKSGSWIIVDTFDFSRGGGFIGQIVPYVEGQRLTHVRLYYRDGELEPEIKADCDRIAAALEGLF